MVLGKQDTKLRIVYTLARIRTCFGLKNAVTH
jgi:hypothetical protein